MPLEFKPKTPLEPPKPPDKGGHEFNIFRIREGDVIMTRGAFETMIATIEALPLQSKELQHEQAQNIVRALRMALGD